MEIYMELNVRSCANKRRKDFSYFDLVARFSETRLIEKLYAIL